MNSLENPVLSMREVLTSASRFFSPVLVGATATISLDKLRHGYILGGSRSNELSGRSVLLVTSEQLSTALALIELDGIVERVVICPPDTTPEYFPTLIQKGRIDTVVSDYELPDHDCLKGLLRVHCSSNILPAEPVQAEYRPTEWVLLSSGTTGAPKMILHTLASLLEPIHLNASVLGRSLGEKPVWGTFYDIRRYGGLQIFLRAMVGGGSLVLSSAAETAGEHLTRLGECGVTHLSGTPSHWRRALMSPEAHRIAPSYIRLSGEIVDQAVLNALHSFYPRAAIGHAFASTEAGVGFEVNDGLAGFPAALLNSVPDVDMKICNGSLRIRSKRAASRYLNARDGALTGPDGFVDTGDIVELRGDRYYFLGRRNGVINVGGLKVYPEEVEAVINRHPAVRMSVVRPRKNPITGSLVSADIMLKQGSQPGDRIATIKCEISELCRQNLAQHKIPVILRYVSSVDVAATGKLVRHDA